MQQVADTRQPRCSVSLDQNAGDEEGPKGGREINFSHVEVVSNFANVSSRGESSNSELPRLGEGCLLFAPLSFIRSLNTSRRDRDR